MLVKIRMANDPRIERSLGLGRVPRRFPTRFGRPGWTAFRSPLAEHVNSFGYKLHEGFSRRDGWMCDVVEIVAPLVACLGDIAPH